MFGARPTDVGPLASDIGQWYACCYFTDTVLLCHFKLIIFTPCSTITFDLGGMSSNCKQIRLCIVSISGLTQILVMPISSGSGNICGFFVCFLLTA